jgi:arylsulfatase A-like enzyme
MSVQTNRKPNFLIILIDDMGVHQMGCYGSRFYETPHLDRLAAQSLVFDQAYATAPVCSPSRAGLYTGRHPARLHLTNYIPGTEPGNALLSTPPWTPYLPVEEPTIGDHFKAAGYETVHFGKWHLATDYNYQPGRPTDPESHGFDRVVYTRKPKPDADPDADPHHIDTLTDHARTFLGEPHDKPFICFVAHNAIHRPEMAPKPLIDHFAAKDGADKDCNRPVLAAMVSRLDTSVGRLLDALDQSPEKDNTIVVFTADHGAFGLSEERKPLRGAKADLYEGGVRIPLLVRLPGTADRAGRVETVTPNTDFLPTVAELAGIDLPAGDYDGRSIAACLTGEDPGETGDLFWHFPHYHHQGVSPCGAMRSGRYKLVEWFEASIGGNPDRPAFELYDLETDPFEDVDISAENPELTHEMAGRLEAWRQSVCAQPMTLNADFDPVADQVAAPPPPGDPVSPYES